MIGFFLVTPLISLLPDYLSLWKGRFLLERSVRHPRLHNILLLVVIDLFLSFLISYCAFALVGAAAYSFIGQPADLAPYEAWSALVDGFKILLGYPPADQSDILVVTFTLTTLMTSIWVVLVLLAALGTKLLTGFAYFVRVINWIFDVDAHPVRVLGLVASLIVWTGSLMYGLI